ncbi:uncharacterized protein [Branchiostoma lanceolatum]|uniref:uncharacterized protein isoform X2 n=1 Tax=Branchiostoma lanceolatum TaxID=7740 RepID=UPI003456D243
MLKMKGISAIPVAAVVLSCVLNWSPTNGEPGCLHHLTGVRGYVRSITDATSDICEWNIKTDENKLILINFDRGRYRRGSDGCSADTVTFHDGSSTRSNIIDTFCGDGGGYLLFVASTGNQLRVVFNHSSLTLNRTEFNLTFTTREIVEEPVFDERTFVPQYGNSRSGFVQFKPTWWYAQKQTGGYPFGYKMDKTTPNGGSLLEFYLAIESGRIDVESTIDFICSSTHTKFLITTQSFLPDDSHWRADDWPWIPSYHHEPWERVIGVLKFTFHDVQVGEENSYLNEIECVANGVAYRLEVVVTACPIGWFGRVCMERCQCSNGASCHSFNGACKCAPGWRGRNCTTENPEVRISPSNSSSELTDLRYGQKLQFNCKSYKFAVANIAWFFENDVSVIGNVTEDRSSTLLFISSLLPQYEGHVTCQAVSVSGDKYNDVVDIRITGCQDNLYGERCDQVCNCTGLATCNRTLGCVCQEGVYGEGCPRPDDAVSQSTLLSISLTSGGVVAVLLIVIFLLHRQNNRMRVGAIDDPEVFKLGQNLQAVMPRERGPSSISIDIDMLKEREVDRTRLQIGQLLGEGAFGHVVKATLEQPEEGDVVVAVKKLKDDAETTARTALLRETCIMLLCGDHDNVIGLKGICFRDGPLQLVLEYAEHGCLLHLLWTLRAESKTNMAVLSNKRHIFETMMVEVCSGLEHLASSRLVHRDIAARNILICGRGTAKIADFGLARDTYAVGYHRQERGNDLLPLKWMAPEGLKNAAKFTPKSDVI